jgi:hypothetical protein
MHNFMTAAGLPYPRFLRELAVARPRRVVQTKRPDFGPAFCTHEQKTQSFSFGHRLSNPLPTCLLYRIAVDFIVTSTGDSRARDYVFCKRRFLGRVKPYNSTT